MDTKIENLETNPFTHLGSVATCPQTDVTNEPESSKKVHIFSLCMQKYIVNVLDSCYS